MNGKRLVERLFEAENQGDVGAIVSTMSDDVVLELTCRLLYAPDAQTTFRGKEAVHRVYAEDVKSRGPSFRIEAERIIEEGPWVVAEWIVHRGGDSGTIRRGVDVFQVRAGRIARGTVYLDLTTVPRMHSEPV